MQFSVVPTIRRSLLITTLVALLPALLIIVVTGYEEVSYLEESVKGEISRQVEAIGGMQEETVASVRRLLQTVAGLPAFRESDYDHQKEVLQAMLRENRSLLNVAFSDDRGVVVTSPGLPPGTDLSDRKHIRDALRGDRFVAGEYILARVGDQPSFPFASPVRDESGRTIGVISATYPVASYTDLFGRLDLPEGSMLGLVDHQGTRLFHAPESGRNPIGEQMEREVFARFVEAERPGIVEQTGFDGRRRFYAFRPLFLDGRSEPYLYVVVGFPEEVAGAPGRELLIRNLLFMAGVILLAIMVARFLGHLVLGNRLDRLLRTAARIRDGDLTARTGLRQDRSEISRIATAMDAMAERLQLRAREKLEEEERLARSLEEKEVLLREIHHRVKNNMQLILSIVHLQRDSSGSFESFADDLESRIAAMAAVHEMLYESSELSTINITDFLNRVSSTVACSSCESHVSVELDDVSLRLEKAIPVALIANELLLNAVKYGRLPGKGAEVEIGLGMMDEEICLSVSDKGPGFPKGFSPEGSSGLGMKLVTALAEQIGGRMEIGNAAGGGRVELRLPLEANADL